MLIYKVKLNHEEIILLDYEFVDVYKDCSIINIIDINNEPIRIMNLKNFNYLLRHCECMTNVSLVINQKDLSVEQIINITNKEIINTRDYETYMTSPLLHETRTFRLFFHDLLPYFKLFVNDLMEVDNYSHCDKIFFDQINYYQFIYDTLTDKYKLLLKEKISNHKKTIKEQIKWLKYIQ